MLFFFFFFQAEDGIRDGRVTGVQTCALPISAGPPCWPPWPTVWPPPACTRSPVGSEERRVGKSVDLGGRRIIKKKKTKFAEKVSSACNIRGVVKGNVEKPGVW